MTTTPTLRHLLALLHAAQARTDARHRARIQAVLDHVRTHPGQAALQIAHALGRRPGTTTAILDALELTGLVTATWHGTPARRTYTATPEVGDLINAPARRGTTGGRS